MKRGLCPPVIKRHGTVTLEADAEGAKSDDDAGKGVGVTAWAGPTFKVIHGAPRPGR